MKKISLCELIYLIKKSVLFLSVDSGPSHLAHFGGVSSHLSIYPSHVSRFVVANPMGHMVVCQARDLSVATMIKEIEFRYSRILSKIKPISKIEKYSRLLSNFSDIFKSKEFIKSYVEWNGYSEFRKGHLSQKGIPVHYLEDRDDAVWRFEPYWKKPSEVVSSIGNYFVNDVTIHAPGVISYDGKLLRLDSVSTDVALNLYFNSYNKIKKQENIYIGQPTLIIDGPGYDIWGHWIIEFLPRIAMVHKIFGDAINDFLVVVPDDTPSWVDHMLSVSFSVKSNNIFRYDKNSQNIFCKKAIVPSFCFSDDYTFHEFMREYYQENQKTNKTINRKLCISRSKAEFSDSRPFVNRNKFEEIALERGFEIIHPQENTYEEQIKIFSESKIIVGEYGSAMHNAVFSKPGTIVGLIGQWNAIQMRLSEIMGHQSVFLLRGCKWPVNDSKIIIDVTEKDLNAFFDIVDR